MLGIGKRLRIWGVDEEGDPAKRATAANDRSALAIFISLSSLFLVAVMGLVLSRSVDSLARQVTAHLDRLSELQTAMRGMAGEVADMRRGLADVTEKSSAVERRLGVVERSVPGSGAQEAGNPDEEAFSQAALAVEALRDRASGEVRKARLGKVLELLDEARGDRGR